MAVNTTAVVGNDRGHVIERRIRIQPTTFVSNTSKHLCTNTAEPLLRLPITLLLRILLVT